MEIIIDGIIYQQQKVGGVSRIFTEILPRMCEIDDSLKFSILTTNKLRQNLPTASGIKHRELFEIDRFLKPAWLWRKYDIRGKFIYQAIDKKSSAIWHSTYFTRLSNWPGMEFVSVYDLIHELYPQYFTRHKDDDFRKIKEDCIRNADLITCISRNTQEDIVEYYDLDIDKTRVIHLAHHPVFQKRDVDRAVLSFGKKPYLLYVGTRPIYKNFALFIKAYSRWKYRSEVEVVVVGSNWLDIEKAMLLDLGIQDNIHLLSDISDDLLVNLYNLALGFVFPSLYEGFGIPLLEAMACGCPIVASRIPTTVEVAGDIPYYFETSEIESLLNSLNEVYEGNSRSKRIMEGIEHAKKYSWDKTAQETLKAYQSLV